MDDRADNQELPRIAVDPEVAALMPRFYQILARDLAALEQALDAWDVERIGHFVHGLKGVGGSFGFPEITRLGADAEVAVRGADEASIRSCAASLIRYTTRVLAENRTDPQAPSP